MYVFDVCQQTKDVIVQYAYDAIASHFPSKSVLLVIIHIIDVVCLSNISFLFVVVVFGVVAFSEQMS